MSLEINNIQDFHNRFNEVMEKDVENINLETEKRFENVLAENINKGNENGIKNIVGEMAETQKVSKSQLTDVLLGRADNAHEALINMEKAKLEMQYATSIREKAVSGINQMLNMQI